MTRRERMEQRVEKRREWAEGRQEKAASLLKQNEPYHGDIAFNTQPGHIPERARVIRRSEKAYEHGKMAVRHEQVADTLEQRLETTIFSDDENAVEALQEKISTLEAKRARIVELNKAIRREIKKGEGWTERIGATEAELRAIQSNVQHSWNHSATFPAYVTSNIGGQIQQAKRRIEAVKAQQGRQAEAEQAGGMVVRRYEEHGYCSVTFAEKPSREVIEALKGAHFYWSQGCWSGKTEALPAAVLEMEKQGKGE